MNELLKYLGVIILLVGVAVLALPFMQGIHSNTLLLVGMALIIGGFFTHIFMHRKVE